MPAYVISEVEILDVETAEQYRQSAAQSTQHHGGRYLVRGALPEAISEQWPSQRRLVIVEFPDMPTLRAWYDSPEYAPARELSTTALRRRLLFVEGVPSPSPAPQG
jgi:uncharacterized protein (DUF1330 family)